MVRERKSMITDFQRGLMEHTVSLPDRNWFGTNKAGKDAEEFDKLVEMGYATRENAPEWTGDDYIYRLTREGKGVL
jgi:hypothetical protein